MSTSFFLLRVFQPLKESVALLVPFCPLLHILPPEVSLRWIVSQHYNLPPQDIGLLLLLLPQNQSVLEHSQSDLIFRVRLWKKTYTLYFYLFFALMVRGGGCSWYKLTDIFSILQYIILLRTSNVFIINGIRDIS